VPEASRLQGLAISAPVDDELAVLARQLRQVRAIAFAGWSGQQFEAECGDLHAAIEDIATNMLERLEALLQACRGRDTEAANG